MPDSVSLRRSKHNTEGQFGGLREGRKKRNVEEREWVEDESGEPRRVRIRDGNVIFSNTIFIFFFPNGRHC